MTHCSACGRKLRPKFYPRSYRATSFGNKDGQATVQTPDDWLNHDRECPRYGQHPDAEK